MGGDVGHPDESVRQALAELFGSGYLIAYEAAFELTDKGEQHIYRRRRGRGQDLDVGLLSELVRAEHASRDLRRYFGVGPGSMKLPPPQLPAWDLPAADLRRESPARPCQNGRALPPAAAGYRNPLPGGRKSAWPVRAHSLRPGRPDRHQPAPGRHMPPPPSRRTTNPDLPRPPSPPPAIRLTVTFHDHTRPVAIGHYVILVGPPAPGGA